MTGADLYYRAFRAFKEAEAEKHSREREKIKDAVSAVSDASDLCEYTFYECEVESDWIIAVEEGLDHIEKTIEAQRRFIKYEGETVRIEKAKRTTVESVKHLARHSDLIKEERGDSVMPEKLYVVENEENFAVYENRFIFMLLTMLNNFISIRYNAMTNARTRARYVFSAKRNITAAGRKIAFNINFDEYSTRLDAEDSAKEDDLYARAGIILTRVVNMLDTPLMKIVSQAPMLKPPIVRTNVIKMNPHFFAAYELYTYILAYDKDGYTVKEYTDKVESFDDRLNDLLCDSILFDANIAYIGSERVYSFLKNAYDVEEAERQLNAEKLIEQKLAESKEKLDLGEIDALEYIRTVTEVAEELKREIGRLHFKLATLEGEIEELSHKNETADAENERLRAEKSALSTHIEDVEKQLRAEIQSVKSEYAQQMLEQSRGFDEQRKEFEAKLRGKDEEMLALSVEYAKREKELIAACNARIRAARLANGEGKDEDNSLFREDFVRLEDEKRAFDAYYKQQWTSAKKNIRKKLLWNKTTDMMSEDTDNAELTDTSDADVDKEN